MEKKQKGLLVAGAAALAAFFLLRGKASASSGPPIIIDDPIVPPPPTPGPSPTPTPSPGNGAPSDAIPNWTGWKGKYQTEEEIGVQLSHLGYSAGGYHQPGFSFANQTARNAVKQFQADYNKVAKFIKNTGFTPTVPGTGAAYKTPPKSALTVDGWIGPNTWSAMVWAFGWKDAGVYPVWAEMVGQAS